jgi:hypothetical protein
MDFLVEMREFAARITQEKLALNPDGGSQNVHKQQRAIRSYRFPVVVKYQVTPGDEEAQLVHQAEAKRKEDEGSDENGIGNHGG